MRLNTFVVLSLLSAPAAFAAPVEADELLTGEVDVEAVQERLFQLRHELSFGVGVLPLDAFYKGLAAEVGYTFHFSDHFSWRVARGFYSYNLTTGLQKDLEAEWGATPSALQRVEWGLGSDFIFRPIYAKGAALNRSLLWFELYLLGGASVFKMNNGFAPAVNLGGGVRVFQSQHLSLRLEAADHFVFAQRRTHVATFQLVLGFNFGGQRGL